jgi:glycosyltransferase 2 family protein
MRPRPPVRPVRHAMDEASAPVAERPASVAAPNRWVSAALIACGVVILAVFVATTNFRELRLALRDVRPVLFLVAALAILVQIFIKAFRWRYLVARLTGTAVSIRFAAISIMAGVAAGSITPARSFELAKPILLKDAYGTRLGPSTSAMIVERMLDIVLPVGALLLAAIVLPHRMLSASGILIAVIAVLLAGSVIMISAPVRVRSWAAVALGLMPLPAGLRARALGLVAAFSESLLLSRRAHTLGPLVFMTAISTILEIVRVSAVFWAMGAALSIAFMTFTYVGAAFLGMALLIPGGVGVTEVSQVGLIMLLAPHAIPSAVARSTVLLDRFLSYYLLTLIGAVFLVAYHRYRHIIR